MLNKAQWEKTMEKCVVKQKIHEGNEARENLVYWLSRPPEERLAAVDALRKQYYGTLPRLQRVVERLPLHHEKEK